MKRIFLLFMAGMLAVPGFPQQAASAGPYKVQQTIKVGGEGFYDYLYADTAGRKLYIPRLGDSGRIAVFDLDTFESVGEISNTDAHGATVDAASHHGFGSSNPVAMWDSNTLAPIKTIAVEGHPDGILDDPFNSRIYVFSHIAPNATVLDAKDGSVVGTIDLGGEPEEAVSDGKGHVYIAIEDKGSIAVVDAKTMSVMARYHLAGKGDGCAGLAIDVKNDILFATCRRPQNMVIFSAVNGKIFESLPIGRGSDGAVFDPNTMEAFSSQGDGTMTIVKENSPTSFAIEQTLQTASGARTLTLDSKTNRVFTVTGELAPAPQSLQGGRLVHLEMTPGSFSILVIGK